MSHILFYCGIIVSFAALIWSFGVALRYFGYVRRCTSGTSGLGPEAKECAYWLEAAPHPIKSSFALLLNQRKIGTFSEELPRSNRRIVLAEAIYDIEVTERSSGISWSKCVILMRRNGQIVLQAKFESVPLSSKFHVSDGETEICLRSFSETKGRRLRSGYVIKAEGREVGAIINVGTLGRKSLLVSRAEFTEELGSFLVVLPHLLRTPQTAY